MKIAILLISFLITCTTLFAQDTSDKEYVKVELSVAGTLGETLGNRANQIDSLVVEGLINASDLWTMWSATFYGRLSAINLKQAQVQDKRIPEMAFYHFDEQFNREENALYVTHLRNIILGEGIEEIGANAFAYSTNLQEVTLPKSLRRLGECCFGECYNMHTSPLIIPEGIEEIPRQCFTSCAALSEVVLPSTIKIIGSSSFYNTGLTKINFPEGLEEIGDGAFYNANLNEAVLPESCIRLKGTEQFAYNRNLKKLQLSDELTTIPSGIAFDCKNLSQFNIPANVKTIGSDAFCWCPLSGTLTLPEGLTDIGANAFYQSTGLTEVTFPSTLTTLYKESCYGWASVKKMYCRGAIPAECQLTENGTGPFGQPDRDIDTGILPNIPVYIPIGAIERYRNAKGWDIFVNFIESEELSAIETTAESQNATVTCNGSTIVIDTDRADNYTIYSPDGRIIASGMINEQKVSIAASPGYYIVIVGNQAIKVKISQ